MIHVRYLKSVFYYDRRCDGTERLELLSLLAIVDECSLSLAK